MNSYDHARMRFLNVCAALDDLEKRTPIVGWMRDGGYAWAEHQRLLATARFAKRDAFEQLQAAKVSCPPRSRPVKLR